MRTKHLGSCSVDHRSSLRVEISQKTLALECDPPPSPSKSKMNIFLYQTRTSCVPTCLCCHPVSIHLWQVCLSHLNSLYSGSCTKKQSLHRPLLLRLNEPAHKITQTLTEAGIDNSSHCWATQWCHAPNPDNTVTSFPSTLCFPNNIKKKTSEI